MVLERITKDIPSNITRIVEEAKPKSGKSGIKILIDTADRFGQANKRALNKTVGTVTRGKF